jgi:RNA polymerase sigma-70 factor, ECF subfamily
MNTATQTPLADLLRRVECGDEPALGDLQQQTRKWLTSSIQRIVKDPWHGEEVLQDVYTYIWRHAAEYRDDRGTPMAWLGMIARSRAVDRFRLNQRDRATVEFNELNGFGDFAGRSDELLKVSRRFLVREVLRELSANQQHLVRMAFFDGFSHTEIAERTGLPLGTVKTKIRKALITLREKLVDTKLPRVS